MYPNLFNILSIIKQPAKFMISFLWNPSKPMAFRLGRISPSQMRVIIQISRVGLAIPKASEFVGIAGILCRLLCIQIGVQV